MTAPTSDLSRRIGRGLGWSTVGNIVLRVGNVLTGILMAHLIAPREFGVFAIALTLWSIIGTLAELGLGTDLIRAHDLQRRIPTVATLGLLSCGGIGLSMMLAAQPLASVFGAPQADGVVRLMAVSIIVFGLAIVPTALLQREFRQRALALINLSGMLSSAVTMAFLAWRGHGAASLAWGQIANQVVIVILLYRVTRWRIRLGFDRTIARESLRFCLPLALANVLSWVLLSVDNVIVANVLGTTQLGLYVLAFNVSSWPMTALGQSLRVVALPAFSHAPSETARNRALAATGGPVWAVAVLMGVGLSTLAAPTISLLYGDRWTPAAVALAGLGVFGALRVMFDLLATFLAAVGRSTWVLGVQVWWLIVMVPAMWLGVREGGLPGAGWTHAVIAAVAVLPAYLWCLHRVHVDVLAFLRGWLVPSVAIVPTGLACWWIADHVDPPLLALLCAGVAALVLYVGPMARWWIARIRALRHSTDTVESATKEKVIS